MASQRVWSMALQQIRYRIRPDGVVEEEVSGVAGAGCEQLTDRIEARLGALQRRRATSEAFADAALLSHGHQTLHQLPPS